MRSVKKHFELNILLLLFTGIKSLEQYLVHMIEDSKFCHHLHKIKPTIFHRLTNNLATQTHQRYRLEYRPSQSCFDSFLHNIRSFVRIVLDSKTELNSGLHDREYVSTVAAGAQTCRHRHFAPSDSEAFNNMY